MADFPKDDDGDVLRSLQAQGVNLALPRRIEFYCYAKNATIAELIAKKLTGLGYESSVFFDAEAISEDKRYSVYSASEMVPTYDVVVREQEKLNAVLIEYNTRCDGWGTLID